MRILLALCLCALLAACTGGSDLGEPGPPDSRAATEPGPADDTAAGEPTPTSPPTVEPTPLLPPGEVRELRITGPEGEDVVFAVEVVADQPARQQGLMHRTELASDAGMLFLFPGERTGGFWMKNTLIPLSIAFTDAEGVILVVLDMEPCEADPCPTYEPGVTYAAALEVNQGAFGAAGVGPGWKLQLDGDMPTPS